MKTGRRISWLLLLAAFGLPIAPVATAGDTGDDGEIEALQHRLETLQKELQLIQARLRSVEKAQRQPSAAPAGADEGQVLLISDRMDVHDEDRFEFYGQVRGRYEYRTNPQLDDQGREDLDQMLLRTRFGVKAHITDDLKANILLQDSRVWGEEASTASDEEGVDLKIGTIEWMGVGDGRADFILGRQVLAYGEQKLIGAFEWSNTARSFDAFRVNLHGMDGDWQGDLFASVLDEEFGGDDDEEFYGFYNVFKVGGGNHSLEPYLLLRRNNDGAAFPGGDSLEEYTLGFRASGHCDNGWGYAAEGAYQFGDRGDLDIDAYALHGRVYYKWDTNLKPKLLLEANLGSGDDDPNDGDWGRFDNLFPTNHLHYGYADFFSWSNLEHYRLGFAMMPYENGKLGVDFHLFSLETTEDAWFNAGGAVVRAADPTADDDAGWELDITWKHKWENGLALLMGYSYFEPGNFATDTGTDDEVQFFYVQSQVNF